jgi:glutaredoxin 3
MAKVEIYTTRFCPYCIAAKRLLTGKGVAYSEIDVSRDAQARADMLERACGRMTVPQIFIGVDHVGGFDDLYALDQVGGLDPLLAALDGTPATAAVQDPSG